MMDNPVQNFVVATKPLFEEIEQALLAHPVDVNGLLQKMDILRKRHILFTVNAATLQEHCNSRDTKEYVIKTVKVVSDILLRTNPAFTTMNPLQHLRNMVLDHIYFIGAHRLAVLNEEPVICSFIDVLIGLYEMDNEENCLLVFKIILKIFECINLNEAINLALITLEKVSRKIMECYKDINFEMCLKTHVNGVCVIKTLIENLHSPLLVIGPEDKKIKVLPKATKSLQVLAEAPQVINRLLEMWYVSYGCGLIDNYWKDVVETFLKIINLKCDENLRKNSNFCEDTYIVILKIQISSLEFLVQLRLLLRKDISNHKEITRICCGFLNLLQNCPPSANSLQRKLVKVFQVILSLKFVFDDKMEEEMEIKEDETPLVTGRDYLIEFVPQLLCYNSLDLHVDVRASYLNVLLCFLNEVHLWLTKEVMESIVEYFLPFVYQSSLPVGIHNAMCRLLVKFVKHRQEIVDFFPPHMLLEMLQAFNMRLKVFVKCDLPFIHKKLKENKTFFDCEDYCCSDFSYYHRLWSPSNFIYDFKKSTEKKSIDESKNTFTIQSCKDLIENIFQGAYGVAKLCVGRQQGDLNYIQPFSDFLKYSVQAMGIYCIPSKSYVSEDDTLNKHRQSLLDLVGIFMLLPPAYFPKIFSSNVNILLEEMRKNPPLRMSF